MVVGRCHSVFWVWRVVKEGGIMLIIFFFLLLMCACVIDVRIRHWLIPYLTVLCDFFLLVAFGC